MKRYEISNCEWERIKDKLPAERTGTRGRPAKNNRIMLNGMLWIARTGAQWREMPECYGSWQSVYARFRKWQKDGVWEKIFHTLSSDAIFLVIKRMVQKKFGHILQKMANPIQYLQNQIQKNLGRVIIISIKNVIL